MAEKNALKSVKLPSFKVICLKLTDVCMVAGTGGEGRGGEGRGGEGGGGGKFVPPTIQRKNTISQLSGAISSLFLELGKLL